MSIIVTTHAISTMDRPCGSIRFLALRCRQIFETSVLSLFVAETSKKRTCDLGHAYKVLLESILRFQVARVQRIQD